MAKPRFLTPCLGAAIAACLLGLGGAFQPGFAAVDYSSLSSSPLVFSPDGQQLALGLYLDYAASSGESYPLGAYPTPGEVEVYRVDSNTRAAHFWLLQSMVGMPPRDLAFSPDDSKLAATWYVHEDVTGARGATAVWDLATGEGLPLHGACGGPGLRLNFLDARRLTLGSIYEHSWHTSEAFLNVCDLGSGQSLASFPHLLFLEALPGLKLLSGSGYVAENDGNQLNYTDFLGFYDSHSYAQLQGLPTLTTLTQLNAGKGIAEAVTAGPKPRRVRIDLKTRRLQADLGPYRSQAARDERPYGEEYRLSLADGRQLRITPGYENGGTSRLDLLDARQQILLSRKVPARMVGFAGSPDGSRLAMLACAREPDIVCELGLWRLSDLRLLRSWPIEIDPARREQPPEG